MHIGIISKVGIQKSLTLANDLELSLKKDHDVWISDVSWTRTWLSDRPAGSSAVRAQVLV